MGEGQISSGCLLNRSSETFGQARTRFTIISHFSQEFVAGFFYKLDELHRYIRLASAKTSSAE